ncbi:MAG: hypothetical protein ABIZ07_08440 [Dermatophilaceae bacterium]
MEPRVILVVADPHDVGGRATARAAAALPPGGAGEAIRVVLVTGDDVAAARWSHHLDRDGRASTTLTLPGLPRPLSDEDLAAVCFRAQQWSVPTALRSANEADIAYAYSELSALLVSWLHSLGARVLNRVEGNTPCGPGWSPDRWRQAAAQAGLPIAVRGEVGVRSVLVAGDHVLEAASGSEALACQVLARQSACRLLDVVLTADGGVSEVRTVPDLASPTRAVAAAHLLQEVAA